jgi:glycosyltransferase involved in cell wall biosynthesis
MKILFIIDSLRAGGKERRLIELLKGLNARSDIKSELIVMSNDIHYREIFNLNVKIHYFPRKVLRNPIIFIRFYKICRIFKPSIVHSWDFLASLYFGPIARLLGIKLINGSITSAPIKLPRYQKRYWVVRITYFFSNVILTNSSAGLKSFRVPKRKGVFIHNGFDINRLSNIIPINETRKKYNIHTKHVVGMIASFTDFKDYDSFIAAARKILCIRKDTTFIGIGDGKNRQVALKSLTPEERQYIRFPGIITDVESIVKVFTIGILLSTNGEGFPNSVMEYMALGKPVIATNAGGTNELVKNENNGILLENNDPTQIAYYLNLFLDNPDLSQRMGENGKNLIKNSFNLDLMVNRYVELYSKLGENNS